MLPGFYSAFVRAVMDEKVISNTLKQIRVSSNEVGFAVAPRITGHDAPDANGNMRITLGAEFDPLDANLRRTPQVIVDGEVYTRVNADPPANPRVLRHQQSIERDSPQAAVTGAAGGPSVAAHRERGRVSPILA